VPIKSLSTTPGNNNATPPNGAPEGATNINQITDIFRQLMADIRGFWETPGWRDMGHTPTYVSSTSFSVTGDQRAFYFANQRIRISDSSTLYGTIASVAYTTVTTVTVTLDSGSISASISAVAVGLGDANKTLHYNLVQGTPSIPTADSILPAGMIAPYAGSSAPTGWLLCRGQTVSRTTYATLFAAIGTTYGVGDGSTTFGLPDLQGRVVAGLEATATRLTSAGSGVDGGTLGANGGSQFMQQHNHGITETPHSHGATSGQFVLNQGGGINTAGNTGWITGGTTSANTATASTGITVNNAGSGSSQNVQPTIILNYIIKVA
jgi:microcystin-dependent protein